MCCIKVQETIRLMCLICYVMLDTQFDNDSHNQLDNNQLSSQEEPPEDKVCGHLFVSY